MLVGCLPRQKPGTNARWVEACLVCKAGLLADRGVLCDISIDSVALCEVVSQDSIHLRQRDRWKVLNDALRAYLPAERRARLSQAARVSR